MSLNLECDDTVRKEMYYSVSGMEVGIYVGIWRELEEVESVEKADSVPVIIPSM